MWGETNFEMFSMNVKAFVSPPLQWYFCFELRNYIFVILANAGIQAWIPAYAGMTNSKDNTEGDE